MLLINI